MIDPALGALGIAHATPVLELGGDFDRQPRAGIDPGDIVILGRTGPDIHMVGLEADVARHRQAARGGGRILGRKPCADRRHKPAPRQHRHRTETPQRHQPVSCRATRNSNFFELKPPANARKNPSPRAPLCPHPGLLTSEGFLSWPGLLIERTERQEPERPDSLPKIQGKYWGTQGTYLRKQPDTGTAWRQQCRTTGLMRTERRACRRPS